MLVYFSSAQLAQSQAVAPPALLPLLHESMLLCKNRRLFTVASDNSHVLTPIPMHLIPIPIPWLILLPFPWDPWDSHAHLYYRLTWAVKQVWCVCFSSVDDLRIAAVILWQ